MLFTFNTVVNTRPNGRVFLKAADAAVEIRNNLFAGQLDVNMGGAPLPKGNVLDPGMRFTNAAGHEYRLAPGSAAIDASDEAGVWQERPAMPDWQYAHTACQQVRTAVGRPDAGAYEAGVAAGEPVCGMASSRQGRPNRQ